MSNCTKCCSGKSVKLTTNAKGQLSRSCPGDGTNPNADLCAATQAAIACAPSNLVKKTGGNGVKILSTDATQNAIVAEVLAQTGCPGKFIETGCVRAQTGVSGCIKIDTSKRADGTDASIVDAATLTAAGCDLGKSSAEAAVAAGDKVVSASCRGCK